MTESAPTANPERNRNRVSIGGLYDRAHPAEEITNSRATARKIRRRPNRSAKPPVKSAPTRQPAVNALTISPIPLSVREKSSFMEFTAPEIPAMFRPKRNPPSTAMKTMR